jgi:hypothetical protein
MNELQCDYIYDEGIILIKLVHCRQIATKFYTGLFNVPLTVIRCDEHARRTTDMSVLKEITFEEAVILDVMQS